MSLCVILGNGPSLKGFDFARLEGVASVGMNAAYRYWDGIGWYPTYYACLDDQLIETHHQRIYDLWKEGRIRHFFLEGGFFAHHPDCVGAPGMLSLDQVVGVLHDRRGRVQGWERVDHPAFRTSDHNKITTGAYAVRFAAWLGHDVLGIAGVDLKYVELLPEAEAAGGVALKMRETPKENPNYFFDGYQQKGDRYNIPNPDVHANRLHIDAFHTLARDFRENCAHVRVLNTNPASLLQEEKVVPFWPMDRLLDPPGLSAVVVPTNRRELPAILDNFRIWADPHHAPRVTSPEGRPAPTLAFVFNNATAQEEVEPQIRAGFEAAGMARHFAGPEFVYLDLEGVRDRYERDYSREVGPEGYKAGPNNQFFGAMRELRPVRALRLPDGDRLRAAEGGLARGRRGRARRRRAGLGAGLALPRRPPAGAVLRAAPERQRGLCRGRPRLPGVRDGALGALDLAPGGGRPAARLRLHPRDGGQPARTGARGGRDDGARRGDAARDDGGAEHLGRARPGRRARRQLARGRPGAVPRCGAPAQPHRAGAAGRGGSHRPAAAASGARHDGDGRRHRDRRDQGDAAQGLARPAAPADREPHRWPPGRGAPGRGRARP